MDLGTIQKFLFIFVSFFLFCSQSYSIVGAIEGEIPKDHPASFNTVALVKKLKGDETKFKIFCSGFIVSPQIIMTAKHCLGDLQLSDYMIYFGNNTHRIDPNLLRAPLESSVYGPKDWQNYFPSFDSAWIKISDLPNADGTDTQLPHFRPVPVLVDAQRLVQAETIHLAGYGNQSAELMTIIAGEKKHVATNFKKYMNTTQVASLVLLQGQRGHNNCHGDSGGPAYAAVNNPQTGQIEWFVFGSAAGFDLALTPESYEKLDDDLFPFVAYCDRAQTLYTFIGDYIGWVESSSGSPVVKTGNSPVTKPGIPSSSKNIDPQSFKSWCENTTFLDAQWLTVRKLLIDAMEKTTTPWSQDEIFLDCEKAELALDTLSEIEFKKADMWDALEPLASLKNLRQLRFVKTKIPNFSAFQKTPIKKLILHEMGIQSFDSILGFEWFTELEELDVAVNKIRDISILERFSKLTKLNISWNQIENLNPLETLRNLNSLDFSSNQVQDLSPLYSLHRLEVLVGSNNNLVSSIAPENPWPELKKVYLINNQLTNLDFLKGSLKIQHSNVSGNPLSTTQMVQNF